MTLATQITAYDPVLVTAVLMGATVLVVVFVVKCADWVDAAVLKARRWREMRKVRRVEEADFQRKLAEGAELDETVMRIHTSASAANGPFLAEPLELYQEDAAEPDDKQGTVEGYRGRHHHEGQHHAKPEDDRHGASVPPLEEQDTRRIDVRDLMQQQVDQPPSPRPRPYPNERKA